MNSWILYIVLFLFFSCIFTQGYKLLTKKLISEGSLTVILQFIGSIFILIISLFFKYKFPSNIKIYLLLFISIIFYAISDRLNTKIRKDVDTSSFSILKQFSTIFLVIIGIIFLKEKIKITTILGTIFIISSNVFLLINKGKLKLNKTVIFSILANLSFAIAISLDINISNSFNLPIYISIILFGSSTLIFIFEKIKLKDLKKEYLTSNKKILFITSLSWGLSSFCQLRAYTLGKVTIIAPVTASVIILNAMIEYVFFKEKTNLLKKIICGITIIISVILIGL